MLRKLRPHLTYANVAATLALVIAVGGGTAWAAQKIRTRNIAYHAVTASKVNYNAITASKVKNGSLSGKEIRNSSIAAEDVRNGTLTAQDFGAGQLPKGDKGDKGDPATSIFGAIAANGTLGSSKNVTASAPPIAGRYTVTINQDVSKCVVVATLSVDETGTVAAAPTGAAAPQQIAFQTHAAGGGVANRAFSFAVYC
jgi:hypothetical protein